MSMAASRSHVPSHASHHSYHSHISHHAQRSHASQREGSHTAAPTVTPFDSISQVSSRQSRRERPPTPESEGSDGEAGSVAPADSISQVGSSHRSHASSKRSSRHGSEAAASQHSRGWKGPSHASSASLTSSNLHAHDEEPVIVVEMAAVSEHISRAGTERSVRSSRRGRALEVEEFHQSHAGSHHSRSPTPESRASTAKPGRQSVVASVVPSHGASRAPTAHSSHSTHSSHSVHSSHSAHPSQSGHSSHSTHSSHSVHSSHSAHASHSEAPSHSTPRAMSAVPSHVGSRAYAAHSSYSTSRAHSEISPPSSPRTPTVVASHAGSKAPSVTVSRSEEVAELDVESKHSSSNNASPGDYHTRLISPGSIPIRTRQGSRGKVFEFVHHRRHSPEQDAIVAEERSPSRPVQRVPFIERERSPIKYVERAPAPSAVLRGPSPRPSRADFDPPTWTDRVYDVEVEKESEQYDDRKYRVHRKHMYPCHEYE